MLPVPRGNSEEESMLSLPPAGRFHAATLPQSTLEFHAKKIFFWGLDGAGGPAIIAQRR